MLDGDLEEVLETLRNDAVRGPSVGQTALRRLLSSSPLDSRLTPESRDGRVSNSGSVSVRGVSPARNSYFRNPTEEEFRSPLVSHIENREEVEALADVHEMKRVSFGVVRFSVHSATIPVHVVSPSAGGRRLISTFSSITISRKVWEAQLRV